MSTVRIRCSAPDPYQGLRGRAYIQARGLTPKIGPMRNIQAAEDCRCQACEQARLLPAVLAICESHERRKITDRPQPMWNNLADESLHELLDLPLVARM